jgi:hypothetical protein
MAEKQDTQNLEHGLNEKEISLKHDSLDGKGPDGIHAFDGATAEEIDAQYDQAEVRKILRKIDFRLIPLLGVLYL